MTDDERNVVRVEVEVPTTPEQVWEAIATGPGIETWFVPAELEQREGGEIVTHHGEFGDSRGVVTGWDPPRRFAYEERDWNPGEGVPPWATEILVEARAGGTSIVRLASGIFGSDRDWSDEIGPTREGWMRGLGNLRIYLTHFAGQRAASMWVQRETALSQREAWAGMRTALGLGGAAVGQRVAVAAAAPSLAGVVEDVLDDAIVIRTATGLFELAAMVWGGPTRVMVRGYLYGADRGADAAREREAWAAWLRVQFPAAGDDAAAAEARPS